MQSMSRFRFLGGRFSALFLALAVMLAVPAMALADTIAITNGLSGSGQTTIAAGDAKGATISYKINVEGRGEDGQGGCNAKDGTAATVTFDLPAGVTADKSSLTFKDCDTTQDVTFKSNTKGTYTISTKTSDGGSTATVGTYKETSFKLNVLQSDTTPPVVGVPADVTAEATSASGAAVTYTAPTATDENPANPAVSCNPASGSTFGLGITPVVCSATDAAGNTGTSQFNVIVKDTTKPVVKVPADVTAEATSASGAAVTYTAPTATDAVDADVSVSCSPASGSTFGLGSTAVNCSGTDDSGNKGEGSFNVKVQDTTKPSISGLPTEDVVKEATSSSGAVVNFPSITASDAVDGENLAVSCATADATPLKSGSTFPIGSKQVDCSVTDKDGNTATGSFKVTVQDTTAPALDLPENKVAEATGADGAPVNFARTANDAVDGAVAVNCTKGDQAVAVNSGDVFPIGTTQVDCSATDKAGNKATGSFKVTVQDTTAPALTLPQDKVAEAANADGAAVEYAASASDKVDGDVAVSCSPASGATFALGATQVDCSATDKAGNKASGSFKVKVQDTTAPTNISFVGGINDGASFDFGDVPAQPSCSASDAVGLKDCVVSGYSNAVGNHTLTATATDNAGNSATKTLSYTVKPWTLKGFYSPVDMSTATTRVWNTVKNGSTVPLKFEIFKGTTELTDTAKVQPLSATKINCDTGTEDAIEVTATGSTSLRYDTTAGQFIYNWKTPTTLGCYSVKVTTNDGSSQTAYFKLK